MNPLAELDSLDLDPAAKSQVAGMIRALLEQTVHDAELLHLKDAAIQAKDLKIEALTHELAHIRRIRFGAKSETLPPLQRDVFGETLDTDLAAIEAEAEQLQDGRPCGTVAKPKRPRAGRQPLPDHLPRVDHLHEPASCTCGHCGKNLVKIGEDVTEQLDVEPAKFFSNSHYEAEGLK
nr:IS66 family transposase zinc-finger binding domain-containing protein [Methylovulum psychrotolerans]